MAGTSHPLTHGFGGKKLDINKRRFYDLYGGMVGRCNRKTHTSYHNYGARGIKCMWKTFEEFRDDMYESYLEHISKFGRKQTSLDRIDVNGDYCKENCRWATKSEQASNTRLSLSTIVDGKKYTSRDIADVCGICVDAGGDRIRAFNKGIITKEQLLGKEPIHKNTGKGRKVVVINGEEYTSRKIADLCGISLGTASQRISRYLEGVSGVESLLHKGKNLVL